MDTGTSASTSPASRARILVVDDDEGILRLLERLLTREEYDVVLKTSPAEALRHVQENPGTCDILLTDLVFPESTGFDLVEEIERLDPSIIRIIMTGYGTPDNVQTSLHLGAFDVIGKPLVWGHLLTILVRAVAYRRLLLKSSRVQQNMSRTCDAFIEHLAELLDAEGKAETQHGRQIKEAAVLIGQYLGLPEDELEDLGYAALLHDIGKIGIPTEILLKPDTLSPAEYEIMKAHAENGSRWLREGPLAGRVADMVRWHQERYDGTGYPDGLQGDQICLGARILAVIDAYDAMRSKRAYRNPLSHAQAMDEIRRHAGTQFDPALVEAFSAIEAQIEPLYASESE